MPAVASRNEAIPPAAPLPTTIASQGPEDGVMDAASLRDSSVMAGRSRSSVRSAAISGLPLLAAVRAVLPALRLAAHELGQDRGALVAELLLEADLRGVVAVDRRVLRDREEGLEGLAAGAGGFQADVA